MRVAVIGGGPSGLLAALYCSYTFKELNKDSQVHLFERNSSLGKKLLLTASGRCNITNAKEPKDLLAHYGTNGRFLRDSLYTLSPNLTISLFEKLGLSFVIEEKQRVFPSTFKSSTVLQAIIKALIYYNVQLHLNMRLSKVEKKENSFLLNFENEEVLSFDKIIIATGGSYYPQTGSSGDGYEFAKSFGHEIVKIKPALAPLKILNGNLSRCAGITLSDVTLFSKEFNQPSESLLITDDGLSGPAALNCSRYINKKTPINICWLASKDEKRITVDETTNLLRTLISKNPNKSILKVVQLLNLPIKLCSFLIEESSIATDKKASEINKKLLFKLASNLASYQVEVTTKGKERRAQVTSGGISTKEINPKSMESSLVKDLYFVGEVLDVDGDSGGYNLQAAFSTAAIAGVSCAQGNPFTMVAKFITI